MNERKETPCITCYHGYLPLDQKAKLAVANKEKVSWFNGDWLVCTDCDGTGTFLMYEHLVIPAVQIFLSGLKQ